MTPNTKKKQTSNLIFWIIYSMFITLLLPHTWAFVKLLRSFQ